MVDEGRRCRVEQIGVVDLKHGGAGPRSLVCAERGDQRRQSVGAGAAVEQRCERGEGEMRCRRGAGDPPGGDTVRRHGVEQLGGQAGLTDPGGADDGEM